MSKYSYIAILLAIVIGFVGGYLVLDNSANKQQIQLLKKYELKLKQQEDSSREVIKKLDKKLLELTHKEKLDSIKIVGLLNKIQQDKIKTDKLRTDIQKLTPNEKVDYLLKRYSN